MPEKGEVIVKFDDVSFRHSENKPILDEVSFTVRRGSKIALMGQNGAGKSTIFHLITKELKPLEGDVHSAHNLSIAIARQVIPRDQVNLSLREFFQKSFDW